MLKAMKEYLIKIGLVIGLALWGGPFALAQSDERHAIAEGRYQEIMADLAEDLGHLHHLRGSCLESERQKWRDYMQEMIRLEDPSTDRKNALVARFNKGYSDAQRRFPDCNRDTAREAERIADEAEELSNAILSAVKY
ncbi:MAG: TIGR02301 family protein [Alphaproteobacteria bacterium]|nr:MAG: TIGR02301 family protein [Alphaproteobacteria bacterium]